MKKLIFSIALLISLNAFSQDSTYNDAIKFNMTDSIEAGITFQRKAFFEAMIYNQRVKSIALQFTVEFYNSAGTQKVRLVKPYSKEIFITNTEFVLNSNGNVIGDISRVLQLYGRPRVDTPSLYQKFSDGRYNLTASISTHYDYVVKTFDNNNKLHATIKAAGQKAAAEGKL